MFYDEFISIPISNALNSQNRLRKKRVIFQICIQRRSVNLLLTLDFQAKDLICEFITDFRLST